MSAGVCHFLFTSLERNEYFNPYTQTFFPSALGILFLFCFIISVLTAVVHFSEIIIVIEFPFFVPYSFIFIILVPFPFFFFEFWENFLSLFSTTLI